MIRLIALAVGLAIAMVAKAHAQAPPVQNVDVHFAAYALGGFGGRLVAEQGGTKASADLPMSIGGGARGGITVPYARVLLQAEVSPVKPKGARDRHRATTVSLFIAVRHRVPLTSTRALEPYLGIGGGVALYDVDSAIWSGRALQASLGLNLFFDRFGGFVEVGWQRFDLGGVPDDGSIIVTMRPGSANVHFDRAQVRAGLVVEL